MNPSSKPSVPLLETLGLSKHYAVGSPFARGGRRQLQALDAVSLQVWPGETLGLVGESGCGKSTLARCLVRLLDSSAGSLHFEGRDITQLNARAMRPLRPRLQMVFQDPFSSLNPRRRVGDLLAEPLRIHGLPQQAGAQAPPRRASASAIRERVVELADLVGLRPEQLARFPHEFSGGQRQRIGIARALALQPRLLVADEPVSALDVSIQAQIINLLADLQERLGLTFIVIAHDLSVVRQVATRTAVMYLGSLVETGPTDAVYAAPAHPYTRALLDAVPVAVARQPGAPRRASAVLRGDPPSPMDPPPGCRFHPRCAAASAVCRSVRPELRLIGPQRQVACHHPLDVSSLEALAHPAPA
jgi:peptide/nickel transport system ATP-binding protein